MNLMLKINHYLLATLIGITWKCDFFRQRLANCWAGFSWRLQQSFNVSWVFSNDSRDSVSNESFEVVIFSNEISF